jgi:hypothetical protein
MKPRHAAALALVGWYLMTPPVYRVNEKGQADPKGDYGVIVKDPLSKWGLGDPFDTAAECATARRIRMAKAYRLLPPPTKDPVKFGDAEKIANWLIACVATDDPRLKEK